MVALNLSLNFISLQIGILLILIGLLVFMFSGMVVLVNSVWHPTWSKTKHAGLSLLLVVAFFTTYPQVAMLRDRIFFMSRHSALDDFTKDILNYGKIHNMSDGLKQPHELNGEFVAYSKTEIHSNNEDGLGRKPLKEILSRDGIDPEKYQEFRSNLKRLKLIEFEVKPGYVAFLYGGFLDDEFGYLVTRNGIGPPPLREGLFGSLLYDLKALGDGWYTFYID